MRVLADEPWVLQDMLASVAGDRGTFARRVAEACGPSLATRSSGRISFSIRRSALLYHIPYYTTLAGALAVTEAIKALKQGSLRVTPLQSYVGRRAREYA